MKTTLAILIAAATLAQAQTFEERLAIMDRVLTNPSSFGEEAVRNCENDARREAEDLRFDMQQQNRRLQNQINFLRLQQQSK